MKGRRQERSRPRYEQIRIVKQRTFDSIAVELFSHALCPFGFTNEGSSHGTFYRKANEDVYHFVCPCLGRSGTWYYVRVFPHSRHMDPEFGSRFPDALSVPTDSWSCLSEHDGVNLTQQRFNCKSEENFRNGFSRKVRPLLINVALPYLDRFQSVGDIIPAIRHPSFLGFALHHVGRRSEAITVLAKERERLRQLDTTDRRVASLLEHIDRLLGTE